MTFMPVTNILIFHTIALFIISLNILYGHEPELDDPPVTMIDRTTIKTRIYTSMSGEVFHSFFSLTSIPFGFKICKV